MSRKKIANAVRIWYFKLVDNIRNFCIIAHIDHGKSTLADRMLEITGTIEKRRMRAQYLDQMELERERGITIKMAPVRMLYKPKNLNSKTKTSSGFKDKNSIFTLNLIDTPGHSDFSYEVSRALQAVEGAVLLVDVTQGIQAQTLANFYNAKKAGLKIIGAVNKVDLDLAGAEEVGKSVANLLGCNFDEILKVSGKTGEGVEDLLLRIVEEVPSPEKKTGELQSLIFDSVYDDHKGDIAFVRLFQGEVKSGDEIVMAATSGFARVKEVGTFVPEFKPTSFLKAGDIGYIATGIKDPEKIRIGDTIFLKPRAGEKKPVALPGYREPKPVVFVSFYPAEGDNYDELKAALLRLKLTDSALSFEPERSEVLGRGFKCGFLGRLHFEIISERLKREFNISVISSFPTVAYKVKVGGVIKIVENPKDFPESYDEVWQPMVNLEIITPTRFLSGVVALGRMFHFSDFTAESFGEGLIVKIKMPLADLIRDFDDKLKSITEGFASFNYEIFGEEKGEVDKLEILVVGEPITGLSRVVARDEVDFEGREMVLKLKKLLPRQQFAQSLQARVRGKIIAREDIPALHKDVTGYLYGGDRTRKMKLWKKQQRGKQRLKETGKVEISPEIFKELLKK